MFENFSLFYGVRPCFRIFFLIFFLRTLLSVTLFALLDSPRRSRNANIWHFLFSFSWVLRKKVERSSWQSRSEQHNKRRNNFCGTWRVCSLEKTTTIPGTNKKPTIFICCRYSGWRLLFQGLQWHFFLVLTRMCVLYMLCNYVCVVSVWHTKTQKVHEIGNEMTVSQ